MKKVYTKLSILASLLIGFAAMSCAATIAFNPTFPYDFGNRTTAFTQHFTVAASGLTSSVVLTSSNPAFTVSLNQGEGFSSTITIPQGTTNRDIYVKFNPASANGAVSDYINLVWSGLDRKLLVTACKANFYESFDVSTIDVSGEGDVGYGGNTWHLKGTNIMTNDDRRLGTKSVRLTNDGDCIQMNFDKKNVGRASFLYASHGSTSGGNFKVQYSKNHGVTWIDSGTALSTPSWNDVWSVCNIDVNITGNIRIRIVKTGNGNPINIDQFCINGFTLLDVAFTPDVLNFGNISVYGTINKEKVVTLEGANLSSNVLLQSNNPAFTFWNGTGWVSSLTIARTTLNGMVVNQRIKFEPVAVGDYSSTISISSTGITKTMPIYGYGVAAVLNDDFSATYAFGDMVVGDASTKTSPVGAPTQNPNRISFSSFSQNGLTSTNQTAGAFDFNGWSTTYDTKCYQFTITPQNFTNPELTDDYLLTLTDMTFDVTMPSAVGRYKVEITATTDNGDIKSVATFENTLSAVVLVADNEFVKIISTTGTITGSTVTFTGVNLRNRKDAVTIKIYASSNDGKFGVDNVKVNAICVKDQSPKITANPTTFLPFAAGYLSTRTDINTPVANSSQDITINGANLTSNVDIQFSGTNAAYFYAHDGSAKITTLTPASGSITNKVIKIYYEPTAGLYGNHTAILHLTTTNGNTINMQLNGYNTPEEYVFIGVSQTNPQSWVDQSNWEHGFQSPATVMGKSKPNVKICAPLTGVGVYEEVQCGKLTINTEPYAGSNNKIGSLTLKGTANMIVDQILYLPNNASDAARKDKLTIENIYDADNAMLNPVLRFDIKRGTIDNNNKPHLTIKQTTNTGGTLQVANNYHIISSPVGQIEAVDIKTIFDGWFLDRFNETTNKWERFDTNGEGWTTSPFIEPGRGYSVNYESAIVLNMYGKLDATSNKDRTFTTTYNDGHGKGYNLLGNPYTAAINLKNMASWTNFTNNYDNVVYLWQHTGNYIGVTSNTVIAPDDAIPMCQGFWVIQKGTAGANSSFTIPYSAVGVGHNTLYKSAISTHDYVTLRVSADNYADQLRLFEVPTCGAVYDDGYDVKKWAGSADAPQMYALEGSNKLSTNSKSDISETIIGFEAGCSPTYTFTANYKVGDRGVYLIDAKNGYIHDFANGSYIFLTVKGDNKNRFKLVVGEIPIGVESANGLLNVNVWSYGKSVYVSGYDGEAFIYDISGRIIKKTVLSGEQQIINIDNPGAYIVKLGSVSQKVIIR